MDIQQDMQATGLPGTIRFTEFQSTSMFALYTLVWLGDHAAVDAVR